MKELVIGPKSSYFGKSTQPLHRCAFGKLAFNLSINGSVRFDPLQIEYYILVSEKIFHHLYIEVSWEE